MGHKVKSLVRLAIGVTNSATLGLDSRILNPPRFRSVVALSKQTTETACSFL